MIIDIRIDQTLEGITSFVEDHLCDAICLGLGLNNQVPQVEENDNVGEIPEAEVAADADDSD